MAGSVLANKMGADQQAGARSNVLNQANADRMGYMQQATDKFNQTLPLASREAQDAAGKTAAGNRLASDTATLDANGNVIPPPSTQTVPGDVSSAFANAARDSRQRGLIQANANANVGGYADANKVLGINLEKAGEWQKIFGSNMSNMAGLVPAELENANYSGAGMRGAGALLGAAGQAAGTAGLMGAGPEWGDLFSNGGPVSGTVAGPTQQGFFNKMFG